MNENFYRLPPHNLEAEEQLLASCLLFPDSAEDIFDSLTPEDFYRTAHAEIYRAIMRLWKKKEPIDIISVMSDLRDSGLLEKCGGAIQLHSIIQFSPVAIDIQHTARIIKEKAAGRKFLNTAENYSRKIFEAEDSLIETINQAQGEFLNIGIDVKRENFVTMETLTEASIDRYEALMQRKKEPGIKTGYESLDRMTGGFFGSKLIIIAARPKIGKTAWALCLARNMAKNGHMVGFFELEMDKEDIDDRWMSMESGINTMCFTTGTGPNKQQWINIAQAAGRKIKWPIIVDDTGGQTIDELKRRIKKMVKMGCEIIFVDQLSKIRGTDKRKSLWEINSEHVIGLKQSTKELKIPIVLLVQLNREVEKRKPPIPHTSDFRMTGSVEEEADMAFLGYRRYPYTEKAEDKNYAWWQLALNRNGPIRKFMMHFEPKTTMFTEAPDDF